MHYVRSDCTLIALLLGCIGTNTSNGNITKRLKPVDLSLPLCAGALDTHTCTKLLFGCWDLNSGPPACTVDPSPMESSS